MTEYPVVTIITVVLNAKTNLKKTVCSVAEQDYPKIEYLVIDGGSTDGSLDVIRDYHPAVISKWLSEKDDGIYSAMNKAGRMASGEWICFLNAGDVFVDSTIVGKVVETIQLQPEQPGIVYGNILIQKSPEEFMERQAQSPRNSHRMYFCHQSAFVRQSLVRQYPYDEHYKLSADLKFFKQCFYGNKRFVQFDFPVVIYDLSGLSNTERERGLRENIAVVKEMDSGWQKFGFLLRLYFVIYWRRLSGKY
ncbi:MAG: glycosyltransferase [Tannerella sp.]|nr:glycosyltransferase [Tannerella sp.]